MEKIKFLRFRALIICIFSFSLRCKGEGETLAAPMKRTELNALYLQFKLLWANGGMAQIFRQTLVVGLLLREEISRTSESRNLQILADVDEQGVSCDLLEGFWCITELSIGSAHENSLKCGQEANFSSHLFSLSHLKSLSFFNCFSASQISLPSQGWGVLAASLESLEFRKNPGLTGPISVSFGELKNLKSLVLVENGLGGELQPCISKLIKLERQNLAGNSFVGRIPDTFGGLKGLSILDLSRNSLSGPLPLSFGEMSSLLKLDLSFYQLQGFIISNLGNLRNLTLLDLSNNRLSGGVTKSVENLEFLQELVLSNNPIGGMIMNLEWENMKSLVVLEVSNTSLTGGIPESIARIKGLRFLGLNDNKLSGEIPSNLARLPNIGAMYLHGNNLSGEIQFSDWFYGKMGRRFGAWGNPNFCYQPTSYVPKGVKQCKKNVMRFQENDDSNFRASVGASLCVVWWLGFGIEVFLFIVLNLIFCGGTCCLLQ